MDSLRKWCQSIDELNRRFGLTVAWLTLGMVMVQFAVVLARYVFSKGSLATQQSILYMHGLVFIIGAGYTLLRDGHVRVDVFYREARPKTKALIDLLGVLLFLLPLCIFTVYMSWSYIIDSWIVQEGSTETSGVPAVFLLKTTIWLAMFLLGAQAVSLGLKSFHVLAGGEPAEAELPNELSDPTPSAHTGRDLVVATALVLVPTEAFTTILTIHESGVLLFVIRLVLIVVLMAATLMRHNWARIAAATVLFVAGALTFHFGAMIGGSRGAMVVVALSYAYLVAGLGLAASPAIGRFTRSPEIAADGDGDGSAGWSEHRAGMFIFFGIAAFVLAVEIVLFGVIPIRITGLVPPMFKAFMLAGLLVTVFRGGPLARWVLVVVLLVGAAFGFDLAGEAATHFHIAGWFVVLAALGYVASALLLAFAPPFRTFHAAQRRARAL